MQLQRFPLIILAFALGGCSVPNDAELEQERTASADAAIRSLPVDDWCKAEADRDIEAKMKLFTTDAVLMPPGNSDVIGQQAIRAWHEKMWQGTKYQCSGTIDEVQVSGDWGMVRGTFSGVFTPASGAPQPSSGRFLNTVQQQADGSWKIASGIWNSENPMSSAATSASPLEGAWVVTSLQSSGGAAIDPAGPGQFIFLDGRYSAVYTVGVTERRKSVKAFDPTEEEMVEQYDTIIVNSGTYQVEGNELTLRPLVAKSPGFIGGSSMMEFSVNGDTLTTKIRQLTSVNGISPEGAIGSTITLRRVP